jgi:ribosomal protein S18 acetylase RimI-like enzyme
MSTITLPAQANQHPQLRALNVLKDLSAVADLIELCFSTTMDNDGQRYLSDMRRASRDNTFLRWADRMSDSTSLPLNGFVWEEDKKIVGNASLIPFRDGGKRIHLIANVATHPNHRRRGIGRALTEQTMQYAREKNSSALWLHVRDDNPGAIKLYEDLGFKEVARRTAWVAPPASYNPQVDPDIQIVLRHPRFWSVQREWLRRLYPESLAWYHAWNFNALQPGFWNWLYLLFADFNVKQWAALQGDRLLATLAWMPHGSRNESLYAALPAAAGPPDSRALTSLLQRARSELPSRSALSLDYPAGEMTDAIEAAGFTPRRTLIWMRA